MFHLIREVSMKCSETLTMHSPDHRVCALGAVVSRPTQLYMLNVAITA